MFFFSPPVIKYCPSFTKTVVRLMAFVVTQLLYPYNFVSLFTNFVSHSVIVWHAEFL